MKIKFTFNVLVTFLFVLCLGSLPAATVPAESKPNILFILADDMGYGDAGCYGQKLIKTPNIDHLATEGLRFTQCYAGDTVCAPSRCCLMTGLHTGHATIRGNRTDIKLGGNDHTVAEILKSVGYTTAIIGKWGLGTEGTLGGPNHKGFDYSFGYLDQLHAHEYWTDHLFRNEQRVEIPPKTYSHDLFTKEALEFVEKQKDKPFFLYLAYTIPHEKYDPPTDEPYSHESWIQRDKNYAAMITRMDTDIGKLMDLLKKLGLEKNTIVFFTSDNGAGAEIKQFQSNGLLRGAKGDLYEGGIREPMIVRWPGKIAPDKTSDYVWAFWDFLPTVAELVGVKPPVGIDGVSVLPTLLGKTEEAHPFLYWEDFGGWGKISNGLFCQAIRMGDWKAVKPAIKKPWELYNLKTDLEEKQDVAAKNPEIMEKILGYLKTARTDSKDWIIGYSSNGKK